MLGILGGMGPAATADFLAKLVALTPASRDQEHIPLILTCLPQTPDRSAAILGTGPSPLPSLLNGLTLLRGAGAKAVVIPCNSSHHWYDELQAAAGVPVLHIADAAIRALPDADGPVVIMATRGALTSGFFQQKLEAAGRVWQLPAAGDEQAAVDAVIATVKQGDPQQAADLLGPVWSRFAARGIAAAIMGCTEIPIAAGRLPAPPFAAIDTSLELARAAVDHAVAACWNRPC